MNHQPLAPRHARTTSTRFALSLTAAAALAALSTTAAAQEAAKTETQLETVVVTGARASAETAQAIKKNSDQVVDSIVAEDIGKFPDKNVAEILGRVTGVQLLRGNGEGNAWPISVRQATEKIEQQAQTLKGKWAGRKRARP